MRSRYVFDRATQTMVLVERDGVIVGRVEREPQADHHVMPDIQPFTDNTGTYIAGRRQWREHLKNNNLNELSRADVANMRHSPPTVDKKQRKEGLVAAWQEIVKGGRNPREVADVIRERLYKR